MYRTCPLLSHERLQTITPHCVCVILWLCTVEAHVEMAVLANLGNAGSSQRNKLDRERGRRHPSYKSNCCRWTQAYGISTHGISPKRARFLAHTLYQVIQAHVKCPQLLQNPSTQVHPLVHALLVSRRESPFTLLVEVYPMWL